MRASIEKMTGEQLLLMNVLYGPQVQSRIEQELDRRVPLGRRSQHHIRRPSPSLRLARRRDVAWVA